MPSYYLFETRLADNTATSSDGVAVTGTGTSYSNKMSVRPEGEVGFQLKWTGTPTGACTLWYSDMDQPALATDADWVQDVSWSPTNPAGSASSVKYVISGLRARWVRVKYVNASGSGRLFGYEAD